LCSSFVGTGWFPASDGDLPRTRFCGVKPGTTLGPSAKKKTAGSAAAQRSCASRVTWNSVTEIFGVPSRGGASEEGIVQGRRARQRCRTAGPIRPCDIPSGRAQTRDRRLSPCFSMPARDCRLCAQARSLGGRRRWACAAPEPQTRLTVREEWDGPAKPAGIPGLPGSCFGFICPAWTFFGLPITTASPLSCDVPRFFPAARMRVAPSLRRRARSFQRPSQSADRRA